VQGLPVAVLGLLTVRAGFVCCTLASVYAVLFAQSGKSGSGVLTVEYVERGLHTKGTLHNHHTAFHPSSSCIHLLTEPAMMLRVS
jgi:hypothetical protein